MKDSKWLWLWMVLNFAFIFTYPWLNAEYSQSKTFKENIGNTLKDQLINDQWVSFKAKPKWYPNPESYSIDSEIIPVTPEIKQQILNLLFSDSSYIFDKQKRCPFVTNFGFKSSNPEGFTLLYSSSCKQITLMYKEKEITLDIDPSVPTWERLIKLINF